MHFGPLADELGPASRQGSPQHPASRDLDDSLIVAEAGMKVGDAMVAPVHVDHDAVERRQPGHAANLLTSCDAPSAGWRDLYPTTSRASVPISGSRIGPFHLRDLPVTRSAYRKCSPGNSAP